MPEIETPPAQIGTYRIVRELGRGGMGQVFLADDEQLHRQVAVKQMLAELQSRPIAVERFLREARAMAGVKSDHIVTIFHVGEEAGMPYFVMEYLEGEPLDQYLEAGKLTSIDDLLRIGAEVCEGLRVAHRKGLIHRDIKPSNIFLESPTGRVKILDFGLARPQEPIKELTHSGDVLGSPHYMAPEQAAGQPVDPRADLFSFGAMLYRMTTGQLPFKGNTTYEVLMALGNHIPPPIETVNPQAPGRLSQLVAKLLQKNPADRPTSIDEVLADLQTLRLNRGTATNTFAIRAASPSEIPTREAISTPAGEATRSHTPASLTPPQVASANTDATIPTRRSRRKWILLAIILIAATIGGFFYFRSGDTPETLANQMIKAYKARDGLRMNQITQTVEKLSAAHKARFKEAISVEMMTDPTLMFRDTKDIFKGMTDALEGVDGIFKGFGGLFR